MHAPFSHLVFTRHLEFLIFPYSWREAPFHRYSGETNRITSPLNVLRDHCSDSLLATNEIETSSRGTDSCKTCIVVLLSIYEGKFFGMINVSNERMDRFDSDKIIIGKKCRSIRSEVSRWTHWKRIYLRGKLMVERRSDEWICLFFFFFFFSSDIITLKGQMQRE